MSMEVRKIDRQPWFPGIHSFSVADLNEGYRLAGGTKSDKLTIANAKALAVVSRAKYHAIAIVDAFLYSL